MKRILSWILTLVLLSSSILSLSSCFGKKAKMIDISLTNESYAIAVSKENDELLSTVNAFIKKIKDNGTLNSILNKYFSEDEANYVKISAGTKSDSKNQLVIATHTQFNPFEFSKYEAEKGKIYSGIDIEIASLLAKEMGKELVILEYNFNDVLSAVSSGNADLAIAGITVTGNREEKVMFSSPYYTSSQVLVTRDNDKLFKKCKTKEDVEKILKSLNGDTIIGAQNDTTGLEYLSKYSVKAKAFDSAIMAVQALINQDIDFVIVDREHAKNLVEYINE